MNDLFIAIEGINGSGKTTQANLLAKTLRDQGYAVTHVREPGSTTLGEAVRNIVKSTAHEENVPMAQLLLYNAARAQLVAEVIEPALRSGQVVIADRYTATTIAYQAFGQGVDAEAVRSACDMATGNTIPDLNIFLDLPVETAMLRTTGRRQGDPKLLLGARFREKVKAGYEAELNAGQKDKWARIDASLPATTVADQIAALALEILDKRFHKEKPRWNAAT